MVTPMKAKGTILKMTISSVLTAIPGITALDKSGEESETMETWSFDSGAPITHAPTGRVKAPTLGGTLFYDAANAVHAAMKTYMRTPATNVLNLIYTDAGPVTEVWTAAGLGMDESFEATKPVEIKFKFTLSGTAS